MRLRLLSTVRVPGLLWLLLFCAQNLSWAQVSVSSAEAHIRELVSLSDSGVDIRRLIESPAARELVIDGRESVYLLVRLVRGSATRPAKAVAVFLLGEIRDPAALDPLKTVLRQSDDPFLRAAAEASLAKIRWWAPENGDDTPGTTDSPGAPMEQVPEEWNSLMRSRIALSSTERLRLVETVSTSGYANWGGGHLSAREYAVLSENWDVSRGAVLEKVSRADEDDYRVATELAVIATRPTSLLRSDAGLQTVLRRFAGSSRNAVKILALHGLASIEDPQAMSEIARMERTPSLEWIAKSLRATEAAPERLKFCELRGYYVKAHEVDGWEFRVRENVRRATSNPDGMDEHADTMGSAGSSEVTTSSGHPDIAAVGIKPSSNGVEFPDAPAASAGKDPQDTTSSETTHQVSLAWMASGVLALGVLVAMCRRWRRPS